MTATEAARRSFKKGAEASEEASKGGGDFQKTVYWGIENGQQCFLRFLTDQPDWIAVDQHQNVPTKAKPDSYPKERKWPEKMSAVCRNTVMGDDLPLFGDCYICEYMVGNVPGLKKAGGRTWALACEREEVIGDGSPAMGGPEKKGRRVGFRDKTRTVLRIKRDAEGKEIRDKDGKAETEEITEKAIVIVNQGYKNFFVTLKAMYGYFGTCLDRDYVISRDGESTDTKYNIINIDQVPASDGTVLDPRKPEHMVRYGFENLEAANAYLEEIVMDHASAERYARFFDPRVQSDEDGNITPTGQSAAPKPDNDASQERLAALGAKVKGYAPGAEPAAAGNGTPAPAPASEAPPAPAEQPAPPPAPAAEAPQPAPAPPPAQPAQPVVAGAMQDFG